MRGKKHGGELKKEESKREKAGVCVPPKHTKQKCAGKICICACSADQSNMSAHKTAPDGSQQTQKACRIAVMTCQRTASSVEVDLIGMCQLSSEELYHVSHPPTTDESTMRKTG